MQLVLLYLITFEENRSFLLIPGWILLSIEASTDNVY